MFGREFFHPVKHEGELDIHRLLTPERAVIIKRRNALSRRNEIGCALLCYGGNERSDRLLAAPAFQEASASD
jgi:hypothetical protein